ncbi:MAG: translation initiation factor IF-2 [Alphaproteobacteria bacterium]|nr:translation initiation factor IF-2 [Alphaproteobacteria bacterium]
MTDGKTPEGEKTLHAAGGGRTLSVKRPETGVVRQAFSHGRSKAVVVEKKRPTVLRPGPASPAKPEAKAEAPKVEVAAPVAAAPVAAPSGRPAKAPPVQPKSGGMVLRTLTEEEKVARSRALKDARVAEEEERRRAQEEAKRRAEEDERLAKEREAAAKRKAEEDARRAGDDEVRRRTEDDTRGRVGAPDDRSVSAPPARSSGPRPSGTGAPRTGGGAGAPRTGGAGARPAGGAGAPVATRPGGPSRPPPGGAGAPARRPGGDDDDGRARRRTGPGGAPAKAPAPARKAPDEGRRAGKLSVVTALDDSERVRSIAAYKRHVQRAQRAQMGKVDEAPQKIIRDVVIPESITVQELANRMATRSVDIIKNLMKQGQMVTINTTLDADTAQLIAEEFGHTVKRVAESDVLDGLVGDTDADEAMMPRAPVVTIMGHVDHGKTSLLDALRQTDVAAGEAGGITQHIGAYQVKLPSGQKITFLDTPGHAAFTAMRARGAKVTDIVVLVVAADDGVMPQTIEAINHAKAAKVPIIVAINKIDKPDATPDRVRTELLSHEIVVESMGGDTQAIEVSATKKMNLDKLEEAILLQAEVLDLKANPNRAASGAIVEAKLDKGRGPVATVLVHRGTVKVGDIVVAGAEWGRVRALVNERGEQVPSAGPSEPVEILGLSAPPEAGDDFAVVDSEARAREVADFRARKKREARTRTAGRASLDQVLAQKGLGEAKILPLVVKSDVQGSVEAISAALAGLSTNEVRAQVLHAGVGGVTQSDIILARASGAPIIAFNVRASAEARELAKRDGVEIRYYSIIYNIIDDIRAALSGMLSPTLRENFLGYAEILEVFNITKIGKVAGCRITEGKVLRGNKVRLLRDNVVIHEGTLSTLKRFKDEVKEVVVGQECGMAFENYQDIQKGDQIECFEVETVKRSL